MNALQAGDGGSLLVDTSLHVQVAIIVHAPGRHIRGSMGKKVMPVLINPNQMVVVKGNWPGGIGAVQNLRQTSRGLPGAMPAPVVQDGKGRSGSGGLVENAVQAVDYRPGVPSQAPDEKARRAYSEPGDVDEAESGGRPGAAGGEAGSRRRGAGGRDRWRRWPRRAG